MSSQHPELNSNEIKSLIAAKWKSSRMDVRTPYRTRYIALKKQYKIDVAAYDARAKTCVQAESDRSVSTVRLAEIEPPMSSMLSDPPRQPTQQPNEPQSPTLSVSPSTLLQPVVPSAAHEHSTPFIAPCPRSQSTERPNECTTPNVCNAVLERALGPMPKAPTVARYLYYKSVIVDIRSEKPGIGTREARMLAYSRWDKLGERERKPFNAHHDMLKKLYDVEIAGYNTRKEAFLSTYDESAPTEQLIEDEVLERELGPVPKRPPIPHRIYCNSVIDDIYRETPRITKRATAELAYARWKALSTEEQQPFVDRYYTSLKQFKLDVAAYNARKRVFISTYSKSASTVCLAEPENPASSSLPVLSPQPTERVAEPERPNPHTPSSSLARPTEQPGGPEMTQSDEKIVRELGPKSKRMLNPYHLFCHITIRDRLKENPGLCVDDAKKGLGTMWTHFSKEERQPHLDRFRAFTEHCNAELVAYYARARALVTAAYGVPEASSPSDVLEWKLGKKPVLPPPPYRLYYLDVVKDVAKDNPGIDHPGLTKTIADKWKGVSRDVRQIYNGRSDDLKREYNANVASYDARERALFKAAIRKVRESRGNRVSNALTTAQPFRQPVASASPCRPPQLARHLNGPGYTAPSLPTGFTGMPPLLPTAIGSP
ncbi:hypothetical protein FBU31_002943, partial [Coemansia sp. 'formosensis']